MTAVSLFRVVIDFQEQITIATLRLLTMVQLPQTRQDCTTSRIECPVVEVCSEGSFVFEATIAGRALDDCIRPAGSSA